jgi:processive 1,2-diacylglycerol beta-glucosyltransferase
VLIVAGAWGVGGLESTVADVADRGHFVPVVVCGRDEKMRHRLTELARTRGWPGVILGWTDRMPALMAASDALVENAGGLTSLEAMRVGLPVVSYKPIAGHGRENTAEMAAVGVSRLARSRDDLDGALRLATTIGPLRQAQIDAGRAMFAHDPATVVLEIARRGITGLADLETDVGGGGPVADGSGPSVDSARAGPAIPAC